MDLFQNFTKRIDGQMLTYKTFMRHAGKVVNDAPKTKPILKGVLHQEDGSCIVTDSFRLYLVQNIHNFNEKHVITPKGKKLNGVYPDVSKIIPDINFAKQEIITDVNELFRAIDSVYAVARIENHTTIPVKFNNNHVSYTGKQLQAKYKLPFEFSEPIILNAKYVLDTFKLFKAAKYKEVKIYFYDKIRPILFKSENILALIMPVRRV